MITITWKWRTRVHGTLTLIPAAAMLWMPTTVGAQEQAAAQEQTKRNVQMKEAGWKANVISGVFPGQQIAKVQTKIEEDRLVCRSGGWTVLDIPVHAITGITRDGAKDYPVTGFLMFAATHPLSQPNRFGSKDYRDEMKARAVLGAFAMFGLLFPKHKEVVRVFWKDEEGEHDAEFRMGRKGGRAMLQKLQQESGVEPRDLEKERKDIEKARKELQRWIKKQSQQKQTSPEAAPTP